MPTLRREIIMGIVTKDQISAAMNAGKALTGLEKAASTVAPNDGDFLAKAERILNGVNQLFENLNKLKNPQAAVTAPDRASLDNPRRSVAPSVESATDRKAQSVADGGKVDYMNKLVKPALQLLSDYLEKCAQENPNMTLTEAIQKAPVNVTQIRGLLELAKTIL